MISAIDTRDSFIYNISYNESRASIIKETFVNRDAFINKDIKDIKRRDNNKFNKDYYNSTKDMLYLINVKRVKCNINRDKLIEESIRWFKLRDFRSRVYKVLRAF